jgi:hypothetical protein
LDKDFLSDLEECKSEGAAEEDNEEEMSNNEFKSKRKGSNSHKKSLEE